MVDILLPTYNGEKYLNIQIDSLFAQTIKDWRLIIRDDGSEDKTISLLKEYHKQDPNRILIIEDELGNLGTSGCLTRLLPYVSSEYFMFCDQDDIWEPNKIEISMLEMKRLEKLFPNLPLLVCSDACCINENDIQIQPSFFKSQKFIDTTNNVHKMLALNIVQGSTTLMNKAVLGVIKGMPNGLYHDWWTAVNVAYYGRVSYIHQPLLRYRQHQSNVVGALNVGPRYFFKKVSNIRKQMSIYKLMYKSLRFKPSVLKWTYYKLIFNLYRI